MLLGALASTALAEPVTACAETWRAPALVESVAAADAAIARMDPAAFLAERERLLTRLGCVAEPLAGGVIGGVHRVVATGALLEKQEGQVAVALAGLLAADPGYQLPPSLYPEGHPLRRLLPHATLLAREAPSRPLRSLPSGWLEVDGLAADRAPGGRAAVVQELDGQGAVVETRYVWPEDDLGVWAAPAVALPAAARAASRARAPLIVATAVSVAATAVLYGLAADRNAAFGDVSTPRTDAELLALRAETNGLTVGWAVAGATSLGLGVGLAVAW